MGEKNRHTVTLSDSVWKWVQKMEEKTDWDKSEIIDRGVKVYAGKLSSGEWKDPKFQDKYDKRMKKLASEQKDR